jgi:hypothetical protein
MRASRGFAFGFSGFLSLRRRAVPVLALGLSGCTLITDVDREKIPQPQPPTFPEVDSGTQPTDPVLDAGTPDASLPPEPTLDGGGDSGPDNADAGDAGPDAALSPDGG